MTVKAPFDEKKKKKHQQSKQNKTDQGCNHIFRGWGTNIMFIVYSKSSENSLLIKYDKII